MSEILFLWKDNIDNIKNKNKQTKLQFFSILALKKCKQYTFLYFTINKVPLPFHRVTFQYTVKTFLLIFILFPINIHTHRFLSVVPSFHMIFFFIFLNIFKPIIKLERYKRANKQTKNSNVKLKLLTAMNKKL